MGLISYFRNLYYDNRLKKADELLSEGRSSEAESYYLYLVDKHPQAACRLAEYYMSLSSGNNANNDVSLYKKVVDLKKDSEGIRDVVSFETILKKHVEYIAKRANDSFSADQFKDCLSLALALKETNNASKDIDVLYSEAKIRLLYNDINSSKVGSNTFKSLIDIFKYEWAVCKGRPRAKESVLKFCDNLEKSKRYYASNQILSIINESPLVEKCLDNAVCIVYGHDSEVSTTIIKDVASFYGKHIILREGLTNDAAVSLFEACWNKSGDEKVVMDVLNLAREQSLKEAFVNDILSNHGKYLSSESLFKDFTKWLNDAFDDSLSLGLLEKVHKLGYDVEDYYTKKVHLITSKMPYENRLSHLDYAQQLFPSSPIIIEDKLACAQESLEKNKNELAIKIADTILEKSEKACIVKASALYNLAKEESNVDKQIDLLNQSQATLNTYKGSDSPKIGGIVAEGLIQAANQLYLNNEKERAYSILNGLAKKGYENAVSAITSHRLSEAQSLKSNEEKYKHTTDAINEIKNFGIVSINNDTSFIALWDERINSAIANCKNVDDKSAVDFYESILKEISSAGFSDDVRSEKYRGVVTHLIKRKYQIARETELASDYTAAALLYREINILEGKRTPTLAALRYALCKLKMQNISDVSEYRVTIYSLLRKAAAAFKTEKEDIAYRFALLLLKSGEDKEALDVLSEFLPNEEYLKKACEQGAVIKALAKIDDFNSKLDSVKNKSLSSKDAVYFINHMLEYAEVIKPVLDLPRATLVKYRNKLKNYAIFKLFDEERYDVAFEKMVKEHKDYLDDLTALRNIALICLNMAESHLITEENYSDVISIWLTAIYQEKLFVKSLDYTSWDDPYTFSLYEAFGHFNEDSVGTLPDNVNMDYSDDNNVVFIKEVQRALLDRFEAAISDNQLYHDFYTSQKDAMDSFISLDLDDKCRLVAPFLAHKDDALFQDISEALEHERESGDREDLLSVGVIYQMPQAIYSDYSKAKSYYEDCIASINSTDYSSVGRAFVTSRITLIKRFKKLSSALNSYSNSKISALSAKNKSDFKNNYSFYLVVCSSLKDNTLSFMFSNYVMQYVVGEVNANSMKKSEAADYILSIYSLDKSNSRVKENITALFEMLARDTASDSQRAVTNILERIKNIDTALYNKLKREFDQAKIDKELNDIVDKVNSSSMSNSSALEKVYSLYKNSPNNSRICANLAQLCTMCIMEYVIGQKYGKSSVTRILDELEYNMSPEFRKNGHVFKKAFDSIWNQLPYETKTLLQGGISAALLNQSLNDKGLALQDGLEYMKMLGNFTTSSRSSLFGNSLFDDNFPF